MKLNKTAAIRIVALTTALGTLASSCSSTDNRDTYLGTMAGAEIGGTIGEAIGWILTDRHEGPGKAMAGSILGTVAGAVIGNKIGSKSADKPKKRKKGEIIDDEAWYGTTPSYQTGGGKNLEKATYEDEYSHSYSFNTENSPQIGRMSYEDEDGDGKISPYETINVIYEVKNNSSHTRDVELIIKEETNGKNKPRLVCSPLTTTTLAAGETIRYKAKIFLKNRVKDSFIDIRATARYKDGVESGKNLHIRCAE